MTIDQLLEQLLNGLVIGIFYAIVALGVSLVFGVLRIVNFAHGELYMLGGFAYYLLTAYVGAPPLLAVVLSFVVLFIIGSAIEASLIRPTYGNSLDRPAEYAIMITFALSILLQNSALGIFGPWAARPPALLKGSVEFGNLIIGGDRLGAGLVSLALIIGAIGLIEFTAVGRAIRATSQDREAAQILGINVRTIGMLSFGLSSALAGSAGALLGPVFNVEPTMGTIPVVKAYVIVVLGGMGSLRGSIVGALILSEIEVLSMVLIPDTTRALAYKDAYGLVLLIAVLLLRPNGLFGRVGRRA